MRSCNLTRFVLQNVRIRSLQYTGQTTAKSGCMIAQFVAAAAGFNADQVYFFVADEVVKDADLIRPATNTGNDCSGKFSFRFHDLCASLTANDFMEVADHRGIGVRAKHAAEQVMRGTNICDPVTHSFVDCVLQSTRASLDATNFCAQQPHAENVQFLATHVFGAHVNHALKPEQSANRRCSDTVLTGSGFSNHAILTHPFDEQGLAEAVVDLVRTGVQQVFALQIDFCATKSLGKPAGKEKRGRTSGEGLQQFAQSRFESWIALGAF